MDELKRLEERRREQDKELTNSYGESFKYKIITIIEIIIFIILIVKTITSPSKTEIKIALVALFVAGGLGIFFKFINPEWSKARTNIRYRTEELKDIEKEIQKIKQNQGE